MDAVLIAAALASALCAAAWHVVGERLRHRPRPPAHRAAGDALAYGLHAGGAFMLVSAVIAFVAGMGATLGSGALLTAWLNVGLGVSLAGCLVAYLAHLLTGGPRAVRIVALAYIGKFALLVAVILALEPVGATSTGWTVRFVFAHAPPQANALLASAVLAPVALASLAYLAILPRAPHATARWRIVLVGGGLAFWLAAAIGGRLAGHVEGLAGARLAGLVAGIAVYAAYAPPVRVQRRWGVRSLADEVVRAPPSPSERAALAARVIELV